MKIWKVSVLFFVFGILLQPMAFSQFQPRLQIFFFDAGYADSSLIILPSGTTILIDAGSKSFSGKLRKYLRQLKVRKIDHLVLTHPHENHFGGLAGIINDVEVGQVYVNGDSRSDEGYEEMINRLQQRNVPRQFLQRGNVIAGLSDGVRLDILHPVHFDHSVNDSSMVLLLNFEAVSFAFLADIEETEQKELFSRFPQLKEADVLTVPHHGRSVSDAFIQFFVGKIFVASTGVNPSAKADEADLQQLIGQVYRTDLDGTILAETDGRTIRITYGKGVFRK